MINNLGEEVILGVSDFVALLNQTLDYAYPSVVINGELANLRISKNRWLYFDLKDEISSVKFFGTVRQLPGPLEDGMLLKVRGAPRLHHQYGFSVNVMSIQPAGEGTIRRAQQLLQAKLAAEGLFDEARKRPLPYPPRRIGLITSRQSAAYADFMKILSARWQGLDITTVDVQVQGEAAPGQIIAALEQFNELAETPEVLVLLRGGGSPEDLAAFSSEPVTRAVAASRIPTLVAIGHEIDISLAELAADRRASTPSNAAELLTPDRAETLRQLQTSRQQLEYASRRRLQLGRQQLAASAQSLGDHTARLLKTARLEVGAAAQVLNALNPEAVLRRGYAIVRQDGRLVRRAAALTGGAIVDVQLSDGAFTAQVTKPPRQARRGNG
ncbi:MAG TPA: exodeoxyribonuclease VII large subunit [Candidatus Saccharimonadales bacterium]|nr:exodeoxyribonuclease VII large subunit [Candidatus Saccharimonadales bacterium]